jgi:hypothetical protein
LDISIHKFYDILIKAIFHKEFFRQFKTPINSINPPNLLTF